MLCIHGVFSAHCWFAFLFGRPPSLFWWDARQRGTLLVRPRLGVTIMFFFLVLFLSFDGLSIHKYPFCGREASGFECEVVECVGSVGCIGCINVY